MSLRQILRENSHFLDRGYNDDTIARIVAVQNANRRALEAQKAVETKEVSTPNFDFFANRQQRPDTKRMLEQAAHRGSTTMSRMFTVRSKGMQPRDVIDTKQPQTMTLDEIVSSVQKYANFSQADRVAELQEKLAAANQIGNIIEAGLLEKQLRDEQSLADLDWNMER